MYADPAPSVRQHQVWVLASLQLATKPVTPAEIAQLLNSRRSETLLPITDPIEVEASLAALMLRPTLNEFISFRTRRASPAEARHRRRIGLGPLSGLVILSACSTMPAPYQPPAPVPSIYSYFGNLQPAAKPESTLSRPVFTGVTISDAFARASAIVDQADDSFAQKTVESGAANVLAYFDDADKRVYAVRKEADLAPTVLADASARTPRPAQNRLVAVQVEPVQLISLSFAPTEPQAPLATTLRSLDKPLAEPSKKLPPLRLSASADTAASSLSVEQTRARTANAGLPPPKVKLDFGDVDRPDLYSDLITFGNSSAHLHPQALARIKALVSAAKEADSIQLRGRFGNRQLEDAMRRVALDRAIAVRAVLIANGVPASKIRIHSPRNSDLLTPSDPHHESNRSVSVFMVVPEHRAAALGLHRDKPIANATTTAASS